MATPPIRSTVSSSAGRAKGGAVLSGSSSSSSSRENSAKTMIVDQITQAVLSTSNLLHLMLQSSPSQAQLGKLPKNLLAMTSTIKNTEQILGQLPGVVSSLDAHMDNGLQSVPHLKTVTQLLQNIESCQLRSLSNAQVSREDAELVDKPIGAT